jgi:hypothetical protein
MDFQRYFPDLEKFRKDVRPALRAILAAREPLPVEILQRLFNWQDEELRDFTRPLASLFPVTKETSGEVIKPYHKSLSDWLRNDAKAGLYFVSVLEGHHLLADHGWKLYTNKMATLPSYLIANLPVHLHVVMDYEHLYLIFRDVAFTEALGTHYVRLPPRVKRWSPTKMQREILEAGWVGEWFYWEFNADPNSKSFSDAWHVCQACEFFVGGNILPSSCPCCGWAGDKNERIVFDELEAQYGKAKGEPEIKHQST